MSTKSNRLHTQLEIGELREVLGKQFASYISDQASSYIAIAVLLR